MQDMNQTILRERGNESTLTDLAQQALILSRALSSRRPELAKLERLKSEILKAQQDVQAARRSSEKAKSNLYLKGQEVRGLMCRISLLGSEGSSAQKARGQLQKRLKAAQRQYQRQIRARGGLRLAARTAKQREAELQHKLGDLRARLEVASIRRLGDAEPRQPALTDRATRLLFLEQQAKGYEAELAVLRNQLSEGTADVDEDAIECGRDRYKREAQEALAKYEAERTTRLATERLAEANMTEFLRSEKISMAAFDEAQKQLVATWDQVAQLRATNATLTATHSSLRRELHGGYVERHLEIPRVAPPPYITNTPSCPAPPYLRPRAAADGSMLA